MCRVAVKLCVPTPSRLRLQPILFFYCNFFLRRWQTLYFTSPFSIGLGEELLGPDTHHRHTFPYLHFIIYNKLQQSVQWGRSW